MSRWSESKTLKFVIRYREYECLWNIGSSLYKNRIARENAYKQLLEFVNDENVTMKMIKVKIKNLRSIYHHELKKIKYSIRSGADAAQIYKPTIAWFEEMHSFLGDTLEFRRTINTEIETSQPEVVTEAVPEVVPEASQMSTASEQSSDSAPQRLYCRGKRRRDDDSLVSDALERLEKISTEIKNTPRNNEDEFYYFALSVAAQLRKLPLKSALHLQAEIQNQLSMARISEINRQISSPSTSTLLTNNE